jgi:hypothetical protein
MAQPPVPHPNVADEEAYGFYAFVVVVVMAALLTLVATW